MSHKCFNGLNSCVGHSTNSNPNNILSNNDYIVWTGDKSLGYEIIDQIETVRISDYAPTESELINAIVTLQANDDGVMLYLKGKPKTNATPTPDVFFSVVEVTNEDGATAYPVLVSIPQRGTVIEGVAGFENLNAGLWFTLPDLLSDVTKLTVILNRETSALYKATLLEERVAALEATKGAEEVTN